VPGAPSLGTPMRGLNDGRCLPNDGRLLMSSRVLIVDDDPDLLLALRDSICLRLTETVVDTAASGLAALKKITEIDYDAIMTDVKMPGMDGLTLMHEILKERPRTPTLIMTGHGEHDLAVKSLQTGAYAFLHKPLDRDFLIAWLKRAIQLRHLTRELEASEARFRFLADAAFEGIAITDHGRVVDVNHSFVLMFGYARDEAISMEPMQFHPPEFHDVVRRMNLSGDETRYEALCLRKNGTTFRAEIRGKSVPYQGRSVRVTALHRLDGAPPQS
jgi:PAS domain S-box-containing protein